MILDLFAGPGGWDVAARVLGLDPVGVEIDPSARLTREAAGLTTHEEGDVRKVFDLVDPDVGIDGLIASPPCQTFSMAGCGKGRQALDLVLDGVRALAEGRDLPAYDDERTALVLEPLRFALAFRPRWIAWEQVPTVLPVWEACAEVLHEKGYSVWTGRLHAEERGVPQTRTRATLIASLDREVGEPRPTHTRYVKGGPRQVEELLPWVSMSEALGCKDFGERQWIPTHALADDPTSLDWTENRPSPTIVGSFAPDVVAGPGYRKAGDGPRQKAPGSVRVSLEEAAALQTFPVGYPFRGSRSKMFQQVGNAIPPRLALHVLAEALGVEVAGDQ